MFWFKNVIKESGGRAAPGTHKAKDAALSNFSLLAASRLYNIKKF